MSPTLSSPAKRYRSLGCSETPEREIEAIDSADRFAPSCKPPSVGQTMRQRSTGREPPKSPLVERKIRVRSEFGSAEEARRAAARSPAARQEVRVWWDFIEEQQERHHQRVVKRLHEGPSARSVRTPCLRPSASMAAT